MAISYSYEYVTENAVLAEVVSLIRQAKIVALDTEFMREKTYYPDLSLIQVAVKNNGEQKVFIIDVQSGIDLSPFLAVIFDRNIIKIFHAALQDLQIFCQRSAIDLKEIGEDLSVSIVDTQIMSNLCGFNVNVGYSFLTEHFFQKQMDKTLQRSDWQKRPLSQEQLEYAASDVVFLEEIYQNLWDILRQKNRQEWCAEEVKTFVDKALRDSQDNLFKKFSFKGRSQEEVFRMKSLILWRESWAKKLNLPRQHFMRDHVVERVVYAQDFNLKMDEQKIAEIKQIVQQTFDKDHKPFSREDGAFMSSKQKEVYKKTKELMAKVALEEGLGEQLLINNQLLKNLVCTKKPIEEILTGWRYKLYGERLKKIILA